MFIFEIELADMRVATTRLVFLMITFAIYPPTMPMAMRHNTLQFSLISNCSSFTDILARVSIRENMNNTFIVKKLAANTTDPTSIMIPSFDSGDDRTYQATWENVMLMTSVDRTCCWSIVNNHFISTKSSGTGTTRSTDAKICYNSQVYDYNGTIWTCSSPDDAETIRFNSGEYDIKKNGKIQSGQIKNCANASSELPISTSILFPGSSIGTSTTSSTGISTPVSTASLPFTNAPTQSTVDVPSSDTPSFTHTTNQPSTTSNTTVEPTSTSVSINATDHTPSSTIVSISRTTDVSSSTIVSASTTDTSSSTSVSTSTTDTPSSTSVSTSTTDTPSSTSVFASTTDTSSTSVSTSTTNMASSASTFSTTPSSSEYVTSSTTESELLSSSDTSSSVLLNPMAIANIDLMCPVNNSWGPAEPDTTVVLAGGCFNGTVDAIRHCDSQGHWKKERCNVSEEFNNTLNQILNLPVEEGLDMLSEITNLQSTRTVTLTQVAYLLQVSLDRILNVDSNTSMDVVTNIFQNIANDIITEANSNDDDDEETKKSLGTRLLLTLDSFVLNAVEPSREILGIGTDLLLKAREFNELTNEDITGISNGSNVIVLPPEILGTQITQPVRIGSIIFRNLSSLLPPRDSKSSIVTPVISSITNCASELCPTEDLQQNVTIQLQVPGGSLNGNFSCVFYKFENKSSNRPTGDWSTDGCTTSVSRNIVTCSCNHLTHFAILLSPGIEANPIHNEILNTVGLVLVPISLLCMVAVILTYSLMRSLWSIRNYIHIMLCVSLFVAQLVFIIGIDKIKNEGACSTIAVILQYLFLVTFMWMLMEGVVLYVTLVRVFIKNHVRYVIGFTVASYVIPAVYMAIVVPIGFLVQVNDLPDDSHYLYYNNGIRTACWLNYSSGFIWSFIVPVAIIIVVNIGFFVMAIVIMRKHSKKQKTRGKTNEAKHWLKASISLTLVMGIAWLTGVLAFRKELLFIAYIMTVFIAGQGILLFIILIPLSKQVREAYKKLWIQKKSQSPLLTKLSSVTGTSFFSHSSDSKTDTWKSNGASAGKSNGHVGGIVMGSFGTDTLGSLGADTLRSLGNDTLVKNDFTNFNSSSIENKIYFSVSNDDLGSEDSPVVICNPETEKDFETIETTSESNDESNSNGCPVNVEREKDFSIVEKDKTAENVYDTIGHAAHENGNETTENEYEPIRNGNENVYETLSGLYDANIIPCDYESPNNT